MTKRATLLPERRVVRRPRAWYRVSEPMAYLSALVGRTYVLRWLTPPDLQDLRTLGPEIADYRKRVGEPLVCLSILPNNLSPPEADVRREMETLTKIWMNTCEVIHVFVGGEGFKPAIIRSIVSAFALATRKRGLVQVHGTLEAALSKIAESAPADIAALRVRLNDGLTKGL